MSDLGSATPDKSHQWGAIGIQPTGRADLSRTLWFAERSSAVTYAKQTYGRRYAIARAWLEGQDPNEHRSGQEL